MPRRDDKKGKRSGFAVSVLWGTVTGYLVVIALFMVASSLILSGKLPESAIKTLTAVTAFFGSAVGTVVAVRRHKSKILATGLTNGAVMFFIALSGTVLSDADGAFQGMLPVLLLSIILGGALGALFCLRKRKRRRV